MIRGLFTPTPLVVALFASSTAMAAPSLAVAAERPFNIPAQTTAAALTTFARQAGVQIFFPSQAIAGIRSPAVTGVMEPRVALDRLIVGTGLIVAADDGRTVMLRQSQAMRHTDSDAATALEDVIVTAGPRAASMKRESDTVVNTITALEIQRLPNLNVSDVLARLPGVRRNETQSGENRYVQIRGLGHTAASQSIDGVLLTTYVDGSRAPSTELLPANFIKNVTVTSTVTPDLDESSNSAHVALTTISGLDNHGQHVLDLRGFVGANSRSDGLMDTRQPIRLAGRWQGGLDKDGRFGLVVGASLDRLGSRSDAVSLAGFRQIDGISVPNGALTKGQTYSAAQRVSAMARLDARPFDRLSTFAEYFYFSHNFSTDLRTAAASVAAPSVVAPSEHSGKFGSAAVNYGFNQGSRNLRAHIVQVGADYDLGAKDAVSFRAGVTFNQITAASLANSGFALGSTTLATPLGYAFGDDSLSFTPGSSPTTANPANYRLTRKVTVSDPLMRDQNYFVRADYSHNISQGDRGLGWKLGAQFKTLDRSNLQRGYARVIGAAHPIALSEVSSASSVDLFSPTSWNKAAFLTLLKARGAPSPDANRLYAADPADGYGQNFNGAEQIGVGYGILSYGLGRARASVGLRAAHTHRDLDQYEPDRIGQYRLAHYEQNYWHVLPSAYGSFDVTSSLKLRAAFTQTIERPVIKSASRRLMTSYEVPVTRSMSYSDPYLMPIRSTNFDASAEYYYGRNAYVSLGAFAKDLSHIPATSSTQTMGSDGVREIVTYTSNVTEVNGKSVYGRVRGLEAVWSAPVLPYVPERLGTLGLNISYDYLVYRFTAINGGGGVAPTDTRLVDGAPRHFFNTSLSYNKGPAAANLFLQIQSSAPSLSYNPIDDRRISYGALLDLQASYQINDNMRLLVEARNLLDQDITDRYGITDFGPAHQIRNNGRTLWLGVQLTTF
ncbi:hypothetical protein DDF62_22655 [Caulobacter radicis]|uniref:TonB-dependent receptor n=1 Tax=Caulobacter radicis TaxID=2172650 RepID=UPI000D5856CB|nr:TonB-dependent receptor [Caulobacter radicis]PVM84529.1 hypothetical protein DDF62_22655 [Caulobacter radicis]